MKLTIGSWNVGGTEYLYKKTKNARTALQTNGIEQLCKNSMLDILLLQEISVAESTETRKREDLIKEFAIREFDAEYKYWSHISIDTERHAHPSKWGKFRDTENDSRFLGQGSAIIWNAKRARRCPL